MSILRGFLCALPIEVIGFVIPYLFLAILPFLRVAFSEYAPADRNAALQELPAMALVPGFGCALVFALAAILNYSPARELGFIRALLLVGLSAILGEFVMSVATLLLDLGPRSYSSDPFLPLRCAIATAVPVVLTVLILQHVIRHQARYGRRTPRAPD